MQQLMTRLLKLRTCCRALSSCDVALALSACATPASACEEDSAACRASTSASFFFRSACNSKLVVSPPLPSPDAQEQSWLCSSCTLSLLLRASSHMTILNQQRVIPEVQHISGHPAACQCCAAKCFPAGWSLAAVLLSERPQQQPAWCPGMQPLPQGAPCQLHAAALMLPPAHRLQRMAAAGWPPCWN